MKIFNGCNYTINFVEGATYDHRHKQFVGGRVVSSIPSNGYLQAGVDFERMPGEFPLFMPKLMWIDALPEDYDVVICTPFYAAAHGQTEDEKIYVIHNPVTDPKTGKYFGALGIRPYDVCEESEDFTETSIQ